MKLIRRSAGYINGVTGSGVFIRLIEGPDAEALSGSNLSLITSILSAGTFFGALIAGDFSDFIGRKWTIIIGCIIYIVGELRTTDSAMSWPSLPSIHAFAIY